MPYGKGTYGSQVGRPSKKSTLKHRTDTTHGHAGDVSASQKPNEKPMDEYGLSSFKAKVQQTADRRDTGGRGSAPFQMKYQGNTSAFPFKTQKESPNKFIGALVGKALGGKLLAGTVGKVLGGKILGSTLGKMAAGKALGGLAGRLLGKRRGGMGAISMLGRTGLTGGALFGGGGIQANRGIRGLLKRQGSAKKHAKPFGE